MEPETKRSAYTALMSLLEASDKRNGKKQKKNPKEIAVKGELTLNQEPRMQPQEFSEGLEKVAQEHESSEDEIEVFEDSENDKQDPFEWHFAAPNEDALVKAKEYTCKGTSLENLGSRSLTLKPKDQPELGRVVNILSLDDMKLKHRLKAPFSRLNPSLSPIQQELAGPMFAYLDVFVTNETRKNQREIQNMYILHTLNHVLKTRDRVLKNNAQLSKNPELEFKDQGYTRPKVLVLLPTRHSAKVYMDALIALSGLNQVQSKKRFIDSFEGPSEGPENKPEDFQHLFAGNTDDLFCIGLKLTRQAIKLYSSFYSSDIIIASPLGLRMIIEGKGDASKGDADFLSSIEILVVDQAHAILMQSWENITEVAKNLNKVPKESHDCDFSRLRSWYLDQKADLLRQTIMVTGYPTPEMSSFFNSYSHNVGGKLKCRLNYAGIISQVGVKIRQVFTRLYAPHFSQDASERFSHFTSAVLPRLMRGADYKGTLIYVPQYSDFVKLRNYLDKHDYDFVGLSEYTSQSQVARGRTYFGDGRVKIMLYSERLHHFRRYLIKGVKTVIFYGIPTDPLFYIEHVRFLARTVIEQNIDPDLLRVHSLYTKWDTMKLERIVGSERVGSLLTNSSDKFEIH